MRKINMLSNQGVIASPMNYIGGKAKLLPQIMPYFPDSINTFYDVFAGGGNVAVNTTAKKVAVNDLNHYVIEILKCFKEMEIEELLEKINEYIKQYDLRKDNKEGFIKFRDDYNQNQNPIRHHE